MKKEENKILWHSISVEDTLKNINSNEKGLQKSEARKRQNIYGKNKISEKKSTPLILKFLKQFHNPLIYILFIAMTISFVFKHFIDGYVIFIVMFINAIIGFIQEYKAEKSISALKRLIITYAKVYRGGELLKVPASELVPGDVISLEAGDKVPADCRILSCKNLRTQEASLTGESLPQEKNIRVVSEKVSLGDRTNMLFMSTSVVSGSAKAVVVKIGNKTQIGKVASSIQKVKNPKIHINEKVRLLAFQMTIFASIGAFLAFSIGFFINKLDFFEIFLFTVASFVGGVPEGLPAIMAIVLAIGARRMANKQAVIRNLSSVETLGVATIIATDKTGTLTSNSMKSEKIVSLEGLKDKNKIVSVSGQGWEPIGKFSQNNKFLNPLENPELKKFLEISGLCHNGRLLRKDGNYEIIGDPTEVSLAVLAKKAGLNKKNLESNFKIIDDFAFSSDLRFRASLIKDKKKNKKEIYTLGAFEEILNKSSWVFSQGKKISLDKKTKKEFLDKASELSSQGLRVLALAYRDVPHHINNVSPNYVKELVLVGLVGMKDPPKKGVKEAVEKAKKAGIRIIMKTGDHKETALAIAKEIGLVDNNFSGKVLTESDLDKLDKWQFKDAVNKSNVFARVTPKTKLKIIQALQEQGEIVAMTGDGINDAPALKKADIGIAMGKVGTDVARESSEVILTDDNFVSIVDAVEQGRIVFQNIRQTSFFLITTNIAESATLVTSLALKFPLPLLPIQLLYLNLVTDTFPGIGLAMEPGHSEVLEEKPRNKKENIINKELIPFLLIVVGLMVFCTVPIFHYFLSQGINKAQTAAFVSMSFFQLFNVFNMRSLKKSAFKIGFLSNKWLNFGILISFILMFLIIYIPWFAEIFNFVALGLKEFIFIFLITSTVFILGELYKFFRIKK